MVSESKFHIGQKVYFMANNKVCHSTIINIKFPQYWVGKSKKIEQTPFRYGIKDNPFANQLDHKYDLPECWLFESKEELIKTL